MGFGQTESNVPAVAFPRDGLTGAAGGAGQPVRGERDRGDVRFGLPEPHDPLRGQRSTSNTASRPLLPPAAQVSPSGEKRAQRADDPSPKSKDRSSSPV